MLVGMERLEKQVFVVTGGKGAIGSAVVGAFEAAGARAIVAGLPEVDVLDAAAAERLVTAVLAREGRLDGVIHTVGGFAMAPVHEAKLAGHRRDHRARGAALARGAPARAPRLPAALTLRRPQRRRSNAVTYPAATLISGTIAEPSQRSKVPPVASASSP